MNRISIMVCGTLAVLLVIAIGAQASPNACGAPSYKVARTIASRPELAAIAISIKPRDVTVGNLLALACQLRTDFPSQEKVMVDVFNDERAAKSTQVPTNAIVEVFNVGDPSSYIANYLLN